MSETIRVFGHEAMICTANAVVRDGLTIFLRPGEEAMPDCPYPEWRAVQWACELFGAEVIEEPEDPDPERWLGERGQQHVF